MTTMKQGSAKGVISMANPHNLISELRAFTKTSPYFRAYGDFSIPELKQKPFDTGIHIYGTFDSEAYSIAKKMYI